MSVALLFRACFSANCKNLTVSDTTGPYDPTENPTGWGGPNESIVQALTATMTIVFPDGSSIVVDVYPTLPSDANQEFVITNILGGLGSTGSWQEGKYIITYDVTGEYADTTPWSLTKTKVFFNYCASACCVEKKSVVSVGGDCDCENKGLKSFSTSWDWLQVMENSANCGYTDNASEVLTHLQDICAGTDCGC